MLRPGGTEVVARNVTVVMKMDENKISTMSGGADCGSGRDGACDNMIHTFCMRSFAAWAGRVVRICE